MSVNQYEGDITMRLRRFWIVCTVKVTGGIILKSGIEDIDL